MADAIAKTAASAQELLQDKELRRKGAQFMQSEAQRAMQNLQIGVERAAGGFGQRLQAGAGNLSRSLGSNRLQLKSMLARIERQIADYQREKALRETRKQPVDVQVGEQLYENMPQDLRTRMWFVLLESPHLVDPLRPVQNGTGEPRPRPAERFSLDDLGSVRRPQRRFSFGSGAAPNSGTLSRHTRSSGGGATPAGAAAVDGVDAVASPTLSQTAQASGAGRRSSQEQAAAQADGEAVLGLVALGLRPLAAASEASQQQASPAASGLEGDHSTTAMGDNGQVGTAASAEGAGSVELSADRPSTSSQPAAAAAAADASTAPSTSAAWPDGVAAAGVAGSAPASSSGQGSSPGEDVAAAATTAATAVRTRLGPGGASSPSGGLFGSPAHRSPATVPEDEAVLSHPGSPPGPAEQSGGSWTSKGLEGLVVTGFDEWELVPDSLVPPGSAKVALDGGEAVRLILDRLDTQRASCVDPEEAAVLAARQALFQAMLQVKLPADEGVPEPFDPECRFAALNEMTAGQEEVDEIINRDINRTFPEHPFFSLADGQQALFRVLKAYSLHDLEVGYCQGMAFAAGVLLMYLPQEPAFRLFCRLMDPDGPNLRRMYLPGLDALKAELSRFEYLVARFMPALYAHLQAFGVPAVLYTSQWLMTAFATPFPPSFCARLIDIMLQDNDDYILMRVALAVMEEVQEELLQLHDFEAIITHLKVQPLQWGPVLMRQVLDRGLNSNLSDTDLESASEHVAAEMARLAAREARGPAAASAGATARATARHKQKQRAAIAAAVAAAATATDGDAASTSSSTLPHPDDVPTQWVGGASAWGLGGSGSALAADLGSAPSFSDAASSLGQPGGSGDVVPLDLDGEYMDMILELNLLVSGDEELAGADDAEALAAAVAHA